MRSPRRDVIGWPPAVVMVLAAVSIALADEPKKAPPAADLMRPVASVNGVPIPLRELKESFEERMPETGHMSLSDQRMASIRMELLDTLIVKELIVQEAKRKKIVLPAAELDSEIKAIKARFPSEARYRESLKVRGLTPHDIRTGVERHLLIKKLTDIEIRSKIQVSDSEMRQYHKEHPEQFQLPRQVRLKMLLVSIDPSGDRDDWEKGRARAQGLADRARKGEDFVELVRSDSDDKNAKLTGGDTGLMHEGALPYAELDRVVYTQPLGVVSEPVRTLYGYVVFRVEESRPSRQMAFEDLNKDLFRKELEQSAAEKKIREWVTELRTKADVKIY